MSREIKFRAWDEYRKAMIFSGVEASLIELQGPESTWKPGDPLPAIGFVSGRLIYEQFTGLKDKNGVEIYEGDIVACPFGWSGSNRKKYHEPKIYNKPVVYTADDPLCGDHDPGFAPMTWGKWWPDQNYRFIPNLVDCWVIGNIHQHPELLK